MASSALLAQIQSGRALRKTVTNDRSAPVIEGTKSSVGSGGGGGGGSVLSNGSSGGGGGVGGPPQLGGLFAGGMPKLKPPSANTQSKLTNLAKPPSIPRAGGSNAAAPATPSAPPITPPAPPPGPPSHITRAVPTPPSRTVPPQSGPGRAVPPPPVASTPSTITRAVPPPPTRSAPTPASPPIHAAPSLPARSVPPPPASSPPSSSGRAAPPPPRSRHVPPLTPSSTTVEAPNSAIHNVYGQTPTSASGRDSPAALSPSRSIPPPPTSSGRKVPPPPPPRGGGTGSLSDTGATPRRLAPPPPPTRPLSAAGSGQPSKPAPPRARAVPPPTRTAPPPIRTAPSPVDGAPAVPGRARVQSAISPTSASSDAELENAIVARMSEDGTGVAPPPLPGGRRLHGRAVSSGAATGSGPPVLPQLDLGGHLKAGSWSRAAAGAPPRHSSMMSGQNQRSAVTGSGSKRIPSPPPVSGQYRFPASADFPKPRAFDKTPKNYPSGRSKGTDFDLRTIG